MLRSIAPALLILTLAATPLWAWGGKEHVQITRIAARMLVDDPQSPPEMKAWLRSIIPDLLDHPAERQFLLNARVGTDVHNSGGGLLAWVMIPDDRAVADPRQNKRRPFDQSERLMHYIDLELFLPESAVKEYRDDLSGKPEIDAVPRHHRDRRFVQAGFLPFATEQAYRELVRCIREEKWLPARPAHRGHGPTPEDDAGLAEEDSALKWAGYLAHYVQDNTQPHHSTLDYQSSSYFRDRRRAPRVHSEFEWRLSDDEQNDYRELREAFWEHFTRYLNEMSDPIETDDLWLATLQVASISYDALPLIGRAAAAAHIPGKEGDRYDAIDFEKFMRYRGIVAGEEISVLELKARHCAWAVLRTKRVLRQAWIEATTP